MRYTRPMAKEKPTSKQRTEDETGSEHETATVIAPGYAVVFHDDPHTPEDFVLHACMTWLGLEAEIAQSVADELRAKGRAVAARYPRRIAEQKAESITAAARPKYPFRVTAEPVEP